MSHRSLVRYNGNVVGHLETKHGRETFVWSQRPFRYFCTENVVVYGMSVGLANRLQEKGVYNIQVERYAFGISHVFQSSTVEPDHHVFNQTPDEAQYLIKVSRHKNQ